MTDPSQPCTACRAGEHDQCVDACGCLADHADDSNILRGFKRLKRMQHPEREAWTVGGWGRPTQTDRGSTPPAGHAAT